MPLIELYLSEDGSVFAVKRFLQNPEFFSFEMSSEEEENNLADLLIRNNKRNQKNVSLEGHNHKAAATEARTTAENSISGGDYLH